LQGHFDQNLTFNHVQGGIEDVDVRIRGLSNRFTRMFINEESIEEEEAYNVITNDQRRDSGSNRSIINEDKERRGEQLTS
jgi:hypothetical protein